MGVPQSLDRKREEDEQKNDQKCLKYRGDLAEGKRNVQHQKHRSALRALKKTQGVFIMKSLCIFKMKRCFHEIFAKKCVSEFREKIVELTSRSVNFTEHF